jgi:hypothetical protein
MTWLSTLPAIGAGCLLLALSHVRHPNPANDALSGELAGLLERLDAGPVAGLPAGAAAG